MDDDPEGGAGCSPQPMRIYRKIGATAIMLVPAK